MRTDKQEGRGTNEQAFIWKQKFPPPSYFKREYPVKGAEFTKSPLLQLSPSSLCSFCSITIKKNKDKIKETNLIAA